MVKLNKWQKELQKHALKADKDIEKRLREIFFQTLKQIESEIGELLVDDKVKFWKVYRLSVLQNMQNQLLGVLNDKYIELSDETVSYLELKQQLGWDEIFYQANQIGFVLDRVSLNKAYSLANYSTDELADLLSDRLYSDTPELAKNVVSKLDTLLLTGKSSQNIAKELMQDVNKVLQRELETEYNKAIRIVRTENTRIYGRAKQKSMEHTKSLGIETKKMWVAAMDKRTRSNHSKLDGVVIGVDEEFEIDGDKALAPGGFSRPEHSINCRCKIVTIIDDEIPQTRRVATFDENGNKNGSKIIKYKNYEEWKEAKYN